MDLKVCSNCKEEKPVNLFYKDKRVSSGFTSQCKSCINEKQRKRVNKKRSENPEWAEKQRESVRAYSSSDKGKKRKRRYYRENKELYSEATKRYRRKKGQELLDKEKERRNNNKHIVSWRELLRTANRRMGKKKEASTIDCLGYSALELKEHLEGLFKEGMTWENHGEWHIDHIKPVSSFDKNTHPSIVNSLKNLQPLWAYENLSKGNKQLLDLYDKD